MSFYNPADGQWYGGIAPTPELREATIRKLMRTHSGGLDLSDGSQPKQRQATGLDLSDEAVRERSDALLEEMAQAGLETGAITPSPSDATLGLEDSGQRAAASSAADELLREMREAGLLFDGGDAA